jgi:hydrogenase small subunit
MIGGKTAESILQTVSRDAAAIVAWGSCASNGYVQAAKPNPTGATPIYKLVDKPKERASPAMARSMTCSRKCCARSWTHHSCKQSREQKSQR